MVATLPMVEVRVGSGTKAHVFRPRRDAEAKLGNLRGGGIQSDYVLCGASGPLTLADGLEACLTCEAVAERAL